MCVRACEFVFRLLAEGVVPDYPVAHKKAQLVGYDFYIRGVLIAYGYVEGTVWFEDLFTDCYPFFSPGDIVFLFDLIVVFIVFISDIELRVGEDEVDKRFFGFTEDFYTVATYYPVEQFLHSDILKSKREKVKWKKRKCNASHLVSLLLID